MIDVYFSWTQRDPEFQHFFPNCNILVSPSLVHKQWSVREWSTQPERVIVDSGAFTLTKRQGVYDVRTCLTAQLRMLEGWDSGKPAGLMHYDVTLNGGLPFVEYQQRVSRNLANAEEYYGMFPKRSNLRPIAVLHALDAETLVSSYLEMYDMGYRHFAIGSLVSLIYRQRSKIAEILGTCRDLGIENFHVLGISSPLILTHRPGQWISSFDTSAPIRQALSGTVLYANPLRRFVLRPNAQQKLNNKSFGSRESLDAPLPCRCPVCGNDSLALLRSDGPDARNDRKIHNAFQLLQEVQTWEN